MKACLKKNLPFIFITTLFSIIVSAMGVLITIILQQVIDISLAQDREGFWRIIVIAGLYFVGYGLVYLVYSFTSKVLIRNLNLQLRKRVLEGIFRRSISDFNKSNTADYISALTNDIKLVEENFMEPILQIMQYGIMVVFSIVLLLWFSPIVTLSLFISMILMFVAPGLFGKALQARQNEVSKEQSIFVEKIKDIFSGYEVIRSFQMTLHIHRRFDEQNKKLASVKFAADKMFVGNETLSQILSYLTLFISIFVAAYLLIIGDITAGTLVALIQLGSLFVQPIMVVFQCIPKIKGIAPVIKRLDSFSDYENTEFTGTIVPSFEKQLEVKQLNFSYSDEKIIIDSADFVFEKGKKYAIVGESGCGKTTLTKLMMGYFSNYDGMVQLDGNELHQLDMDRFNQLFSVIHQNIYMFDSSIKDNICLYENYSNEELEYALAISGVNKFLGDKKDGLAYMVGENGKNLSGGQRQRIAIARALIKKTPILVLDEGTSSIDMQTAYDIESSLLALADLTIITITHKMSSELLSMYDAVIFMESGSIVESGGYEELQSKQGACYQFFQMDSIF